MTPSVCIVIYPLSTCGPSTLADLLYSTTNPNFYYPAGTVIFFVDNCIPKYVLYKYKLNVNSVSGGAANIYSVNRDYPWIGIDRIGV